MNVHEQRSHGRAVKPRCITRMRNLNSNRHSFDRHLSKYTIQRNFNSNLNSKIKCIYKKKKDNSLTMYNFQVTIILFEISASLFPFFVPSRVMGIAIGRVILFFSKYRCSMVGHFTIRHPRITFSRLVRQQIRFVISISSLFRNNWKCLLRFTCRLRNAHRKIIYKSIC